MENKKLQEWSKPPYIPTLKDFLIDEGTPKNFGVKILNRKRKRK